MKKKCKNHPERNAVNFCHYCKEYFCLECLTEGKNYYFCKSEECQSKITDDQRLVLQREKLARYSGSYTSIGHRVANQIIDATLINLTMLLLFTLLENSPDSFIVSKASLFYLVFLFMYYFVFESLFQKTPGKFLTGTMVVMEDGSKPAPSSIAVRTIIRFMPLEPFLYSKGKWPHDRWTNTLVKDDKLKVIVSTVKEDEVVLQGNADEDYEVELSCSKCGQILKPGYELCPRCGEELEW